MDTYAHIFPYSPRPKTPAANFSGQVKPELKIQRAAELRQLFKSKNLAFRKLLLAKNQDLHVVVDANLNQDLSLAKGLCEYYVQCNFETSLPPKRQIHLVQPKKLSPQGLIVELKT